MTVEDAYRLAKERFVQALADLSAARKAYVAACRALGDHWKQEAAR